MVSKTIDYCKHLDMFWDFYRAWSSEKKVCLHDLLLITMSEECNCVAKTEPPGIHVIAKWKIDQFYYIFLYSFLNLKIFINTRLMYYVWNVIARNFLFLCILPVKAFSCSSRIITSSRLSIYRQ